MAESLFNQGFEPNQIVSCPGEGNTCCLARSLVSLAFQLVFLLLYLNYKYVSVVCMCGTSQMIGMADDNLPSYLILLVPSYHI